ncbi:MAG: SUMF1/EgtB/PvdO family nonheme iron enzyme [bacterium]|nr:MAG: SUMF1/EgtB/PvdO family nonheme iron enzyme [bacterium]
MRFQDRGGIDADRVIRGGSWNNNNENWFRCANRDNNQPDNRNNNLGFRVVCSAQLSSVE